MSAGGDTTTTCPDEAEPLRGCSRLYSVLRCAMVLVVVAFVHHQTEQSVALAGVDKTAQEELAQKVVVVVPVEVAAAPEQVVVVVGEEEGRVDVDGSTVVVDVELRRIVFALL